MGINIDFNPEDFAGVIEAAVDRALKRLDLSKQNGEPEKRFYSEREAADMLGVETHVLRDARKRRDEQGRPELSFHRFGRQVRYTDEQLDQWARKCLNREVGEPPASE